MTPLQINTYYLAACVLSFPILIVMVAQWFWRAKASSRGSNGFFIATIVVVIVSSRLPLWFFNYPLNEDEAVFLARAATLLIDPIWFRSIDTTSGGPITVYALALALKLGLPMSYFTCRIVATFLLTASTILFYRLVSLIGSTEVAQVFTILSLSFWLLTCDTDLLHLTSEMVSITCILGSLLALGLCHLRANYSLPVLTSGALLIGLTPWAKLQAALIAVVIALIFLMKLGASQVSLRTTAWVVGMMSLPTAIVAVWSYQEGCLMDLWTRYFLTNLWLVQASEGPRAGARLIKLLQLITGYGLVGTLSAGLVVAWCSLWNRIRTRFDQVTWSAGAVLSVAVFTIYISGLQAPHYLTLLIYPLLLFLASLYRDFPNIKRLLPALLLPQICFFCIMVVFVQTRGLLVPDNQANSIDFGRPEMPQLDSVRAFFGSRKLSISIWGWGVRLFPALNAHQGNRDTVGVYLLPHIPAVVRDYHTKGFIEDLKHRRPELFIDTSNELSLPIYFRTAPLVAPLSACPELEAFVTQHYSLWQSINGSVFFLRRDLVTSNEKPF